MKSKLIAIAALVGAAASVHAAYAADYVTTVDASNPLAYFRLTTPTTGSAVNGYTTTYSTTTGTGPGAPIASDPTNTGATFTGSNSTPSEVTTSLSGGIPGAGSINAWINLAALPSTLNQYFYIAGESQVGNDFDFQIQNDNTLYFYTGGGENTSYALNTTGLVGQWLMVTATYDSSLGASSYRDIYVDGVQVASYTGGVNTASKSSPFTIGYSNVFGGRDFDGSIDEVSVWNYGLSASQVSTIYASAAYVPTTPTMPSGVPEPTTWATMLVGLGAIGGALRQRRRLNLRFS